MTATHQVGALVIAATLLLAPWPLQASGPETLVGKEIAAEVVALDGDTLLYLGDPDLPNFLVRAHPTILVPGKTRIQRWGVSAPEHDAPGGWQATAALDDLLGSRLGEIDGTAVVICRVKDVDLNKRLVAGCIGGDPLQPLGAAMVAAGWAIPFRAYTWADSTDRNEAEILDRAMAEARSNRRGLWVRREM